jgi:serine protease 7 (enterokinase)
MEWNIVKRKKKEWFDACFSNINCIKPDYFQCNLTSALYTKFNGFSFHPKFTDYEKINCNFEDGFCFWIQDLNDDNEWERIQGATFPPLTGPNVDHTFGNISGIIYI